MLTVFSLHGSRTEPRQRHLYLALQNVLNTPCQIFKGKRTHPMRIANVLKFG